MSTVQVSHLYIYPIKSLQGIELKEAEVLEKGFRYDRRWMIVDENNGHVTQRTHTQLSQIALKLSDKQITLSHVNMPDLEVPISIDEGELADVTVWDDTVNARVAAENVNSWISGIAGEHCRLVFMTESTERPVKPSRARNGEHVSFADGCPYLVVGQASLDDLNSRMEADLPMNRFRPNIVVTGSSAYEEDTWTDFNIGDVPFYGGGACKRCVFTTIDQETGAKGAEPLKTLATYRREGNDVIFGLNTMTSGSGMIRVGDTLEVVS